MISSEYYLTACIYEPIKYLIISLGVFVSNQLSEYTSNSL